MFEFKAESVSKMLIIFVCKIKYEYLILSKQIPPKSNVTKMNSSEIILLNFAVKTFPLLYQNFNMAPNRNTGINQTKTPIETKQAGPSSTPTGIGFNLI